MARTQSKKKRKRQNDEVLIESTGSQVRCGGRIPDKMHSRILAFVKNRDINKSQFIRRALTHELEAVKRGDALAPIASEEGGNSAAVSFKLDQSLFTHWDEEGESRGGRSIVLRDALARELETVGA